jgi:Spy/CpxP family protein refolding chaperone
MIQRFITMAALSAALVFAQRQGPGRMNGNPPDPASMIQMRVNRLAAELNLTDAQKAQATTIFTDAHNAGQSIRTSMQSNRQALSDAVKKNDTAAIDQLSATAGALSGQMTAIDSKAEAAFYAILTDDQKAKFDSMPRFGPGGPGGPGPMGPGGFGRMRNPQRQ